MRHPDKIGIIQCSWATRLRGGHEFWYCFADITMVCLTLICMCPHDRISKVGRLMFKVSFRHIYGHIGERQKPGVGETIPYYFLTSPSYFREVHVTVDSFAHTTKPLINQLGITGFASGTGCTETTPYNRVIITPYRFIPWPLWPML